MLLVDDVDKAVDWYKDIFHAKIQATDPEKPPFEWVSLLLDDIEIMFAKKESALQWYSENIPIGDKTSNFIAYIYVDDVDELYEEIKDRVDVIMQPVTQWYGIREFAIKDLFGSVLVFAQILKKNPT